MQSMIMQGEHSKVFTNSKTALCDLCNNEFKIREHPNGLVISGRYFACQDCCKSSSKTDLMDWIKSKEGGMVDFRPIFRWSVETHGK